MNLLINTTSLNNFFNLPPNKIFWVFFNNFGWLFLAFTFLWGVREVYLLYIRINWSKDHESILLAIDIPRGNEQSPKAVENLFIYLAGAHKTINFFEKWFNGEWQKSFSFEIVSMEGYTQFLIYSPLEYRNLVESAVYSQYPDAEISEVDDYTKAVPQDLPDEEYDVWGTEFIQSAPWFYPIKCYQEFEHQMGPSETQFKDPMATLMDLFGSLGPGENLWFQVLITPMGFEWFKDSIKEVDRIFGRKKKTKSGLSTRLIEALGNASEAVYSIWGDIDSDSKPEAKPKTMMDLTPDEKSKVENIQLKAAKVAFGAKFRAVYVAKREVVNKTKVVNGLVGYIKQFSALDLNGLKPDMKLTFTRAQYFLVKSRLLHRKRKIFKAYIKRSGSNGRNPGIYSVEELATVWHFPLEANVKAAMIQKAPGRKADAPVSLPLADDFEEFIPDIFQESPAVLSPDGFAKVDGSSEESQDSIVHKASPPDNLPFV